MKNMIPLLILSAVLAGPVSQAQIPSASSPPELIEKIQKLISEHEKLTNGLVRLEEGLPIIQEAVTLSEKLDPTLYDEASLRVLALRVRAWNLFHLKRSNDSRLDLLTARNVIPMIQNSKVSVFQIKVSELLYVDLIEDFVREGFFDEAVETHDMIKDVRGSIYGMIVFFRDETMPHLTDKQLLTVLMQYFDRFDAEPNPEKSIRSAHVFIGGMTGMPWEHRRRLVFLSPATETRLRELFAEQWAYLFPGI